MRTRSCWLDHGHSKVAVRVPGVAAAVPSFPVLLKPVHGVDLSQVPRSRKVTHQVLALGIDVRDDVVGGGVGIRVVPKAGKSLGAVVGQELD
jgi:hypothetical protein